MRVAVDDDRSGSSVVDVSPDPALLEKQLVDCPRTKDQGPDASNSADAAAHEPPRRCEVSHRPGRSVGEGHQDEEGNEGCNSYTGGAEAPNSITPQGQSRGPILNRRSVADCHKRILPEVAICRPALRGELPTPSRRVPRTRWTSPHTCTGRALAASGQPLLPPRRCAPGCHRVRHLASSVRHEPMT